MKAIKQNETLIIIPVFNEAKNIGKILDTLAQDYKEIGVLVINDGSEDETAQILKNRQAFVISHIFNMGIGASFQSGCQFALSRGYEYIVRMDGDGQHEARFIRDILTPLKRNEVDIVIGSRFLGDSKFKSSLFRIAGIKIISGVLTLMTGKKITDPTSGFCAMNKRAFTFFARDCVEDYPEPEILLHHKNFRIKEVPISMSKRSNGISSISPLKSIYYMYKILFSLLISIFRKEK